MLVKTHHIGCSVDSYEVYYFSLEINKPTVILHCSTWYKIWWIYRRASDMGLVDITCFCTAYLVLMSKTEFLDQRKANFIQINQNNSDILFEK